jgi:hypothetical protein
MTARFEELPGVDHGGAAVYRAVRIDIMTKEGFEGER